MTEPSIDQLRHRYEDNNVKRLLWMVAVSMLVTAGLLGLLGWYVWHPVEASYYTTTIDYRANPVVALDMPNQSDSAIIDWASQAAVTVNTYNFLDWENQITQHARYYFSEDGWEQFYAAFQESENFKSAIEKRLRVTSVVNKRPTILSKGELNGRYTWKVDVPIFETFESPGSKGVEQLIVTLTIARISTGESKQGIGIIDYRSASVGSIV